MIILTNLSQNGLKGSQIKWISKILIYYFVGAVISFESYLLGGIPEGYTADGNQIWKWANGDEFAFTGWGEGSQNGGENAYISFMGLTGTWMITYSWEGFTQLYICSKDSTETQTPDGIQEILENIMCS